MKTLRLILIPELSLCDPGDFATIAENIRQLAPDIWVDIVKRRQLWWRQLGFLFHPCLYVAFYEARKFKPMRGLCLHGENLGKSDQYIRMLDAGFDVIPWKRINAEDRFDKNEWGEVVIIKPDHGREGRGVRLSRPEDVRHEEISLDSANYLVQKFIETGDNPNYYRALTLFGETLYLRKTTNGGSTICDMANELPDPVANAGHGYAELVQDDEVIEFARQMATKAFPGIPLLGQDIVRDRKTGKLYCLEVNPYGSTWHFSTPAGRKLQRRDKMDYQAQFDAFKLAAKVLVDKTRLLAR